MEYTTYDIIKFNSGEIKVILSGNSDLLYCKLYKDLNLSFTAALIAITHLRQKIKDKVRVVMPFLPMSRSELLTTIDILQSVGVRELFTVDIHSEVVCKDINICNLSIVPQVIEKIGIDLNELVIVSPDNGGYKRAKNAAEILNCKFITMGKTRIGNSVKHILHDREIVRDKPVLIVDDIIDSGATANSAAQELLKCGAKSIDLVAIHAIPGKREIWEGIRKIYITNTIEQEANIESQVVDIKDIINKKISTLNM